MLLTSMSRELSESGRCKINKLLDLTPIRPFQLRITPAAKVPNCATNQIRSYMSLLYKMVEDLLLDNSSRHSNYCNFYFKHDLHFLI